NGRDRMILRELSEAIGVSSAEDAVRDLIYEHIRDYVEDARIDALGNLIAARRGTGAVALRVMADARMDDAGLIAIGYDSDGSLRFRAVGGLDARILPGTRVLVGPDRIPGVIMWTPIHLNRSKDTVSIERLRIDIGASSRDSAQSAVERGELVAFDSRFVELGPTVRGKALDDRAGCASLIALVQGERFP